MWLGVFTHLVGRKESETLFFVFVFIWTFALIAGITMVWLLAWAIKRGEFTNLREGSRMIFDEGEPIGEVTDHFPGEGAYRL